VLLIGAEINDLGWPWRVIICTLCFKTCVTVLLFIYF